MRTSLRLLALFIGLGAIWPLAPAHAQTAQATVVATCGTLVTPYVAGQSFPLTMDVTGVLCTASTGGGGGGAVTMANGASVTLGNTADAAYTGSGSATEIAILKGIYSSVNGSVPAGTNSIGAVTSIDGGITTIGLEADAAYAGSGSTTVVGALKGIYAAATAPLAAGSAIIGSVSINQTTPGTTNAIQPIPGTTGGLTTFFLQPAASDNHTNVKNGAGMVYHVAATNNSATINYLRFYNAATGFNGCNSATNLQYQLAIPASTSGAGFVQDIALGIPFSTGISICVSSGYATTDTTNATASAMSLFIGYK